MPGEHNSSQLMNAIGEINAQAQHLRDRLVPVLCIATPETGTVPGSTNIEAPPPSALNELAKALEVLTDTLDRLVV